MTIRRSPAGETQPAGRLADFLKQVAGGEASPPSGQCNACCFDLNVELDAAEAKRLDHFVQDGKSILSRDENGACTYLDSRGMCSIYEDRPKSCRAFDCRSTRFTLIDMVASAISPAYDKAVAQWTYAEPEDDEELRVWRVMAEARKSYLESIPRQGATTDMSAHVVAAGVLSKTIERLPGRLGRELRKQAKKTMDRS